MADSPRQRLWVTIGLLSGMFLSALELSIVATAMPKVIDDLGGHHLYSLPFAMYLLFATVSGPLWGYGSDVYGRRKLYLASLVAFLMGSMLCGAAGSMSFLVAARALQGLGAGGLQTITFTIIGELYPLEQRAKVQGFISAVWGISALIGPLMGGFIVDHFSWRWVFYLNLPFGLPAAALLTWWYIDRPGTTRGKLDLVGTLVFTAGSSLLVYGLQAHRPLLGLAGLGLLILFPVIELRQESPLVPLRLFAQPLLGRSVLGNLMGGMAFFGITAYLPLFAQEARGQSATVAGAILSPATVGWTLSSMMAAKWLPRLGPGPITRVGSIAMFLGFLIWTTALQAPLWVLSAGGLVIGLGMGSVMLSLFVSAQEDSPREVLGSVTASMLFSRNIGGAIGSALMGALLGQTLDVGGKAMGEVFWRVPALSTALSLGVIVLVLGLPAPRARQTAPGGAGAGPQPENPLVEV